MKKILGFIFGLIFFLVVLLAAGAAMAYSARATLLAKEIGRASCRERVYVLV